MTKTEFFALKSGDLVAFKTTRRPEWRVVLAGSEELGRSVVRLMKAKMGWTGPPYYYPDWVDYCSTVCNQLEKFMEERV